MRRKLAYVLVAVAACVPLTTGLLGGQAAHGAVTRPADNNQCTIGCCYVQNQYTETVTGQGHTTALNSHSNAGDGFCWTDQDGVWGGFQQQTDMSLCWQNDSDINGQINLEGCQFQDIPCGTICHRQLWWLQAAGGHYAVKNYYRGTTDAIWMASYDGPLVTWSNVYNAHSEMDFLS